MSYITYMPTTLYHFKGNISYLKYKVIKYLVVIK